MDTLKAIAELLRGRTKRELQMARGVLLAVFYPRRHLLPKMLAERRPLMIFEPAGEPLIVGDWE